MFRLSLYSFCIFNSYDLFIFEYSDDGKNEIVPGNLSPEFVNEAKVRECKLICPLIHFHVVSIFSILFCWVFFSWKWKNCEW